MSNKDDLPLELNSRIGWISEIHPDLVRIKIDFEANPFGQPIWGTLGRAFTKSDIELAIDNKLDCRVEFFTGDLNLPVILDIYTSLLKQEQIVFRAERMLIEGDEELVLRSGDAQITMTARNSTINTEAKYIHSTAERVQKIQAEKISLN
ncbi:hypothetical protein [Vibrio azureus]|nr:hypothetical protein [Vibrio azureus]